VNRLTDDELRALVRQSVAQVLGRPQTDAVGAGAPVFADHPSHFRHALPDSDGPCLIEPSVPCTHCGYCQSHGH
jgi:hypothetical protein